MRPIMDPTAPPHLLPKVRSIDITQSARGMVCSLRLPGVCNRRTDTTVWSHLPGIGKGIATKVSDLHGCYACAACHDCIDRRTWEKAGLSDADVADTMLRALAESQSRLVCAGIIITTKQHLL